METGEFKMRVGTRTLVSGQGLQGFGAQSWKEQTSAGETAAEPLSFQTGQSAG